MLFFAPEDPSLYPPCGMYTLSHIFALFGCLFLISIALVISKNITNIQIKKLTRGMAISITIFELIKIGYKFYYKYYTLDNWLPLAYCSLFIYSLWLAGYGTNTLKKCGESFIVGGFIAGLGFLCVPSTSLMLHPLFHYLSMYSLWFHSCMVFMGILYLKNKISIPSFDNYHLYLSFLSFFSILAIFINLIFDSNMMFYKEPFNMPFQFIYDLHTFSPFLYTLFIFIIYACIYGVPLLLHTIRSKRYKVI